MSRISRSEAIVSEIAYGTGPVAQERNPIQQALDNYHEMERERDQALREVENLVTANHNLVTEVNMVREALDRAEKDRVRFQSISSTLLGRLLGINDCIAGAVKASIPAGIDPAAAAGDATDMEQAGAEAQAILQRVEEPPPPPAPPVRMAIPAPPVTTGTAMPNLDWSPHS